MYLEREDLRDRDNLIDKLLKAVIHHWIGEYTLLSLTLLIIALVSAGAGVTELVRGVGLGFLLLVSTLGLLSGWSLATSPLPAWLAFPAAGAVGVELLFLLAGHLTASFIKVVFAVLSLGWDLIFWAQTGAPDVQTVSLRLNELWNGIGALLVRLRDWLQALSTGAPFYDPIAAAILWGGLIWSIAVWAAWATRRYRNPLQGLTPAVVLLAGSLVYNWSSKMHLLLYPLVATLILMSLNHHTAREKYWTEREIDYASDIRTDMTLATILLTIIIIGVAMLAPALSVQPLVDFVQKITREQRQEARQLGDSLGLEQTAPSARADAGLSATFGEQRTVGLPRSHLLRAGEELSHEIVMFISVADAPPSVRATMSQPAPRYYWRAFTYDIYTGRGWATSDTETINYAAGEPMITATLPTHLPVRQKVQFVGAPDGLLYAAGTLVTADQDYRVAWRNAADPFGAVIAAAEYQADSWLPLIGETQLRTARKTFPQWLQEHYLTLPASVPARVRTLALELTAPAATPYDQARAIEAHLRTYTYTLDLDEVPLGRDVADYFLFDLQRGYCDYYATAMVVLARAAGLPARVVIGYATGAYDQGKARYVITEADAHAWVEIYFAGYGWIEFEPTASRPALDRPDDAAPPEIRDTRIDLRLVKRLKQLRAALLALVSALGAFILAAVLWLLADSWRLSRAAAPAAVGVIYARLRQHGCRLRTPMWPGDTPYQFAAALTAQVQQLARGSRWQTVLTPAIGETTALTNLYVQACYSPRPPDAAAQREAVRTWQRLRARLWLAWLQNPRIGANSLAENGTRIFADSR